MRPYRMPNRKRWLLDERFLGVLSRELSGYSENGYMHLSGSKVFLKAFRKASDECNVRKAVFSYMQRLDPESYDAFQREVLEMLEGVSNR